MAKSLAFELVEKCPDVRLAYGASTRPELRANELLENRLKVCAAGPVPSVGEKNAQQLCALLPVRALEA